MTFELALIGGPWGRRLAPRRAWLDELPWDERLPDDAGDACAVWTRTAFNEYASAAAFAEIATLLLACGAPIDLVAAAGDFVVDEIVHTEAAARLASAFGGAIALDVDLGKLVRPPTANDPLLRAAELIVRTSCVGEALTVPVLKVARDVAGSPLVSQALAHIVADESAHAQLGGWFLDWADARLDDAARAHLGRVAGRALRDLAPRGEPTGCGSGLGRIDCATFATTLAAGAARHVARPLAARGIAVPYEDLAAVGAT
ncbi:MAG TPA: ferritin-like domain-containing protein [Kofleriaceae bacterium]|nr:ferritin-like domain-containing protein [Kofleriaceae bacterium]